MLVLLLCISRFMYLFGGTEYKQPIKAKPRNQIKHPTNVSLGPRTLDV